MRQYPKYYFGYAMGAIMKIAIVDDIKEERTHLKLIANQYLELRKDRYPVLPSFIEFDNGETFLEQFASGDYSLVFLDIYMNNLTGIDVAKRIVALDKDCSIIFFTTSDEHQLDGYGVHAVGYIMKPVSDNIPALYTAMDYVMEKQHPDTSGITVQSDCGKLHLYYRDILYLDCIDRKLYIHLTNRILKLSGSYTDYSPYFLSESRFLECYRNVIVNMDYIETPLDCDFAMKNGEKIPVSRRKRSDVMGNYMKYFISVGKV